MSALLGPDDPTPVGLINQNSTADTVLVCEHAGRAIPQALNQLGLDRSRIESHIGWDIGALGVARHLAARLNAPLVYQRYSRLVYDCNRPLDAPDVAPGISDGVCVPGNSHLSQDDLIQRFDQIFKPYDNAISNLFIQPRVAAFSIHSFTPTMNGLDRPWSVGLLSRSDTGTIEFLKSSIESSVPGATVGLNVPYEVDDKSDWFIPRHAERLCLKHCLIEIRNDLVTTATGQLQWATHLANAINPLLRPSI